MSAPPGLGGPGSGNAAATLGTEQWRIAIHSKLEAWLASDEPSLAFPADLSKEERRYLHEMAPRLGLATKSTGGGEKRYITVSKPSSGQGPGAAACTARLELSPSSARAAREYLSRHPAQEGERFEAGREIREPFAAEKSQRGRRSRAQQQQKGPQKVAAFDSAKRAAMAKQRKKLPAHAARDEVQRLVRSYGVVLVSGATGCGKSTQVPQFVLEDAARKNEHCVIACSQPRRLSAMAVAERVAAERGEKLGDGVGYEVRFERCVHAETARLIFATPGVLLRKLARDGLSGFTHLIIDEVHEEDRDTEFLVVAARELAKRRALKVLLMSATLAVDKFQAYFGGPDACPTLDVGSRAFPVDALYLEDVLRLVGYRVPETQGTRQGTSLLGDELLDAEQLAAVETLAEQNSQLSCPLCGKANFASPRELGDHVADCDGGDDDFQDAAEVLAADADALGIRDDLAVVVDVAATSKRDAFANTMPISRPEDDDALSRELDDDSDEDELGLRGGPSRFLQARDGMEAGGRRATEAEVRAYQRSVDDEAVDALLVVKLLEYLVASAYERAAVLVFVPGWADIVEVCAAIESHGTLGPKCSCVPLHSSVESSKQRAAFAAPKPGVWKVVVSTNVAETSVTIPDVAFVVDSGLEKSLVYDPILGASVLRTHRIAKASADQRLGRAGRTRPGLCFRLWTRRRHKALEPRRKAELLRANLDDLCLQAAALDLPYTDASFDLVGLVHHPQKKPSEDDLDDFDDDGDIAYSSAAAVVSTRTRATLGARDFLSRAVNPPDRKRVDRAVADLVAMGALQPGTERPSVLGQALARLPLPPRLGLAAYYGRLLGGGRDELALPCLLEAKDPYTKQNAAQNKAKAAALVKSPYSDVAALVGAYAGFHKHRAKGGAAFCRAQGLNFAALSLVEAAVRQLDAALPESNKLVVSGSQPRRLGPALAVAALYPNLASRKAGDHGYAARTGAKCRIHHSALASKRGSPYSSLQPSKSKNTQLLAFAALLEFTDSNNRSGLAVATVAPADTLAIVLLCHGSIVKHPDGALVDSWLLIQATDATLDALLAIRIRLRKALGLALAAKPLTAWPPNVVEALHVASTLLSDLFYDPDAASDSSYPNHNSSSGRKFVAVSSGGSSHQQHDDTSGSRLRASPARYHKPSRGPPRPRPA